MPVFTVPIHEFNPCHEPGGRATGGQFCSKDSLGQPTEWKDDPESRKAWQDYFDREKLWTRKVTLGVSLGKISPADARKLGWRADSNAEKGYEPLPATLYHVSTAYSDILRQGLKTRAEIGGVHRGLGGGTDDTISFTEDLKTARAIRSAILEARRVARGEIDAPQLWRMAQAQPILQGQTSFAKYMQSQGPQSAAAMLVSIYGGKTWKTGDPLPESLDLLLQGEMFDNIQTSTHPELKAAYAAHGRSGSLPLRAVPAGMTPGPSWEGRDERFTAYVRRKMTDRERIDATWEMYKRYAMAREHAGGRMDPLFFLTDIDALAKVRVKDIKILQFKPRRGAHGYRVSALGEWRVNTGRAVRYAGLAESH